MDKGYRAWAARWRVPLGFALAITYLILAEPTARLLVTGSVLAMAGLALRAFAAGCLEKNTDLSTSGPYAYTRNPLYLGSLLMGSGLVLSGGSWAVGFAFLGLFVLIYYPVMRREEDALRLKFGEVYECYARAVPLFFPTGRRATAGGQRFLWARYLKNREYEAALGLGSGIVLLVLKLELT